jgi:hypothetical protein
MGNAHATSSPLNSASATANPVSAPPTPTASTAKIQPVMPPVDTAKNISSDELARGEVDKIAAELKQQLDKPKKKTLQEKKEHVADLKPGKDDTIFIDRDGSFHDTKADA